MGEEKSESGNFIDAAGTLQAFAECAEAVAATTKKLEKAAILGDYLKTLSDPDLTRAARYFAGQQFALNDARTTNVGGSIIGAALSEATGFHPEDLSPRWVRLGDPGVFGRIERERLVLDLRTVLPEDDEVLVGAMRRAIEHQ